MVRRNHIFDTCKETFKKYGYNSIETPSIEKRETLTGKYGEEGDQLIFNILPRGEKLIKALDRVTKESKEHNFETLTIRQINPRILPYLSEEALRYDLTVPFARYVAQHRNDIAFPFKRYQIQPVWRADRPAKGRYREFYQCDVDVVGSDSLFNEVELLQIIDEVFSALKIPVTIKINNRKILAGLAEVIGEEEKLMQITVAIDKLQKIGEEGVTKELLSKGISQASIDKLQPLLDLRGSYKTKVDKLRDFLSGSEIGLKGIEEVDSLMDSFQTAQSTDQTNDFKAVIELDVSLARGLNYYTGAIIEVVTKGFEGSICAGGRYDDLTGFFGLKDVSGVGISFGADRIYDVMVEQGLFLHQRMPPPRILIASLSDDGRERGLELASKLRSEGIYASLFPDKVKWQKLINHIGSNPIKYLGLIGDESFPIGHIKLKNVLTDETSFVQETELIELLQTDEA